MKNQKGQSTIEYVLVMGVALILVVNFVNSDKFKELMGGDSEIFKRYKNYLEYSYRHTHFSVQDEPTNNFNNYSGNHESYTIEDFNDTRFFIVRNPYGAP
jgi:hypothetical protein